jgi:hypothetical protein
MARGNLKVTIDRSPSLFARNSYEEISSTIQYVYANVRGSLYLGAVVALRLSDGDERGDEAMNKKILVPLGQYDRIEEMIPYIESVARPGMKVVFLVRYPVDGMRWQKEEYGMRAALEAKELVSYYSWEGNLEKAKTQVTPACGDLRAKGIEGAVDVYAGSLKKAVRSHMLNGDVHLIMTRAGVGDWIAKLFDGTTSVFNWFKRPSFSPVLLINPRARM